MGAFTSQNDEVLILVMLRQNVTIETPDSNTHLSNIQNHRVIKNIHFHIEIEFYQKPFLDPNQKFQEVVCCLLKKYTLQIFFLPPSLHSRENSDSDTKRFKSPYKKSLLSKLSKQKAPITLPYFYLSLETNALDSKQLVTHSSKKKSSIPILPSDSTKSNFNNFTQNYFLLEHTMKNYSSQ